MAYDRIEPFGESRADLRAGIVAAVIANANRGKGGKPFKPADFMPKFDDGKPQESEVSKKLKEVFKVGNPR